MITGKENHTRGQKSYDSVPPRKTKDLEHVNARELTVHIRTSENAKNIPSSNMARSPSSMKIAQVPHVMGVNFNSGTTKAALRMLLFNVKGAVSNIRLCTLEYYTRRCAFLTVSNTNSNNHNMCPSSTVRAPAGLERIKTHKGSVVVVRESRGDVVGIAPVACLLLKTSQN